MTDMHLTPYITTPDRAAQMADWLRTRDGLAVWLSVDLNRPGQTMTTPVKTSAGDPAPKPAWWVGNTPARIITDPADVLVSRDVEVKRFHVALRRGSNGLLFKCTAGATRRIRREVAQAGEGAFYSFDYSTQEAVITKPESRVPLLTFLGQTESDT